MKTVLIVLAVLAAGFLCYVRLAPSDPDRWHVAVEGSGDADFAGGARRVVAAGPETFSAADAYMRALPRTRVLAGGVDAGRVTYITRSKLFGFPDYTTLEEEAGQLRAYARLRFGKSDMGVNRKRLEGLVAALQ